MKRQRHVFPNREIPIFGLTRLKTRLGMAPEAFTSTAPQFIPTDLIFRSLHT